jgi:hypothetical protein
MIIELEKRHAREMDEVLSSALELVLNDLKRDPEVKDERQKKDD